jgi:hypothetical protein
MPAPSEPESLYTESNEAASDRVRKPVEHGRSDFVITLAVFWGGEGVPSPWAKAWHVRKFGHDAVTISVML